MDQAQVLVQILTQAPIAVVVYFLSKEMIKELKNHFEASMQGRDKDLLSYEKMVVEIRNEMTTMKGEIASSVDRLAETLRQDRKETTEMLQNILLQFIEQGFKTKKKK